MAATTTPSISWLVDHLEPHLPELKLISGSDFSWSPHESTITYSDNADDAAWQLLHEAGHALCNHSNYKRDIELLVYEVEAWSKAQELAGKLALTIPESVIEDHIDTYRDWLHARSQCVSCGQTGIQTANDRYRCLHCPARWRVNDSRRCGLRRYKS